MLRSKKISLAGLSNAGKAALYDKLLPHLAEGVAMHSAASPLSIEKRRRLLGDFAFNSHEAYGVNSEGRICVSLQSFAFAMWPYGALDPAEL